MVAICVVFVPAVAVGAVGTPVSAGDANAVALMLAQLTDFLALAAALSSIRATSASTGVVLARTAAISPDTLSWMAFGSGSEKRESSPAATVPAVVPTSSVAELPRPKFVLATGAVLAPVPPSATATSVPPTM